MIEEKLTVGKFVTLQKPKWTSGAPAFGSFCAQPPNNLSFGQSVASGHGSSRMKTSAAVATPNDQLNRNFRWLTYYKGVITTMALGGMDILTGDMSGCWLAIYADGTEKRVAHIGTDDMSVGNSTLVKATWNQFAQAHPECVIAGFQPFTHWKTNPPARVGNDFSGRVWGLVTARFDLYAIYLYEQGGSANVIYRVAGVKKITSSPTTVLANLT